MITVLKPNVSFLAYDFEDSMGILKAHLNHNIMPYQIHIIFDHIRITFVSHANQNHIQIKFITYSNHIIFISLVNIAPKKYPRSPNPQVWSPGPPPEANVPLQTKVWVPELP